MWIKMNVLTYLLLLFFVIHRHQNRCSFWNHTQPLGLGKCPFCPDSFSGSVCPFWSPQRQLLTCTSQPHKMTHIYYLTQLWVVASHHFPWPCCAGFQTDLVELTLLPELLSYLLVTHLLCKTLLIGSLPFTSDPLDSCLLGCDQKQPCLRHCWANPSSWSSKHQILLYSQLLHLTQHNLPFLDKPPNGFLMEMAEPQPDTRAVSTGQNQWTHTWWGSRDPSTETREEGDFKT